MGRCTFGQSRPGPSVLHQSHEKRADERDSLLQSQRFLVTPVDPMLMVWSAVTRQSKDGVIIGPDERIDVMTALKAVTLVPAWQYKEEANKGSIEVGISALRFFFNVSLERPDLVRALTTLNKPRKAPVVLSEEEVAHLLEAAPGLKYKAALSVAYGAGPRVSEVANLKVSDIDSQRMTLRVEQGKGQRDRYVMLSPQLLELLREWWRAARRQVWLFPGQNPVNPMTARQLNRAVHAAKDLAGNRARRSLPAPCRRQTRACSRPKESAIAARTRVVRRPVFRCSKTTGSTSTSPTRRGRPPGARQARRTAAARKSRGLRPAARGKAAERALRGPAIGKPKGASQREREPEPGETWERQGFLRLSAVPDTGRTLARLSFEFIVLFALSRLANGSRAGASSGCRRCRLPQGFGRFM